MSSQTKSGVRSQTKADQTRQTYKQLTTQRKNTSHKFLSDTQPYKVQHMCKYSEQQLNIPTHPDKGTTTTQTTQLYG